MNKRTALNWIIFVALALTWGSSFILMKRGLDAFSSDQVAALRISIAFLFLLPLAWKKLNKDVIKHWKGAAGMGVFGNLIPAFLFTEAETMISSALTGMLNSLTPVFTLITGLILFRTRVKTMQVLGIMVGLAATITLLQLGSGKDSASGNSLLGGILVISATLCYGLSVNIIKSKLDGVNAVSATVLALCIIGPVALIYLFSTDFLHVLETHPLAWQSLGYVSILAIFGTALSVIVYNVLIREAGTLFAASVTYLIPVVAMLWGLLDKEPVNIWHALCIVGILSGVWMVNKK